MKREVLKVAICASDRGYQTRLREYCENYLRERSIEARLEVYESGKEYLKKDVNDILMIGPNCQMEDGIFLKEVLEYLHTSTRIVFISCDNTWIKKAFGRNVYGFLQAPLNDEAFYSVFEKAVRNWKEETHYIYGKEENKIERVHIRQVKYVESKGKNTCAYIKGRRRPLILEQKMKDWLEWAKEIEFLSTHRRYLINMNYISRIEDVVHLVDGDCVPIVERKKGSVIKQYMHFKESKKWDERVETYGEYGSCRVN